MALNTNRLPHSRKPLWNHSKMKNLLVVFDGGHGRDRFETFFWSLDTEINYEN